MVKSSSDITVFISFNSMQDLDSRIFFSMIKSRPRNIFNMLHTFQLLQRKLEPIYLLRIWFFLISLNLQGDLLALMVNSALVRKIPYYQCYLILSIVYNFSSTIILLYLDAICKINYFRFVSRYSSYFIVHNKRFINFIHAFK